MTCWRWQELWWWLTLSIQTFFFFTPWRPSCCGAISDKRWRPPAGFKIRTYLRTDRSPTFDVTLLLSYFMLFIRTVVDFVVRSKVHGENANRFECCLLRRCTTAFEDFILLVEQVHGKCKTN